MLKATLSSAVLLGLLAWSSPSFAEVQNVKVGGDITVRAFHRECLDLNCGDDNLASTGEVAVTNVLESEDDFLMSTVGVNVGADLTENVSTFIRLASERDWVTATADTGDVDLSQAYFKLKELFYSPLTLTVGQQPIVWGRGFVLGSNLLPGTILGANDRNTAITANEFTDFTAFDALRAQIDLSGAAAVDLPLTIDLVYIKLDENTTGLADDVNLMGVNVGTKFDAMNGEFETYYLNKRDKVAGSTTDPDGRDGSVSTLGWRGSVSPTEASNVWGELAYQFGRRGLDLEGTTQLISGDSQQAWAMNLGANFQLADSAWSPNVGAEWRYYSGKDVDTAVAGWHPIAPGYFTTALREFQTRSTVTGFYPSAQTGVTSGATNQHEVAFFAGVKPLEDLSVNNRLSLFWLPVGALPPVLANVTTAGQHRENFIGVEWDTVATYNYTDDVQFGLIYALFLPGDVFSTSSTGPTRGGDDTAQELITSVSVKF